MAFKLFGIRFPKWKFFSSDEEDEVDDDLPTTEDNDWYEDVPEDNDDEAIEDEGDWNS